MGSRELLEAFRKGFGNKGPVSFYRAPGRINLIGEHIDYSGFPVLPAAVNYFITVCVAGRRGTLVRLANMDPAFPSREFENSGPIPPYEKGDWGNYCKAACQALLPHIGGKERSADILVQGSIPRGAGLSSSSALVVCIASALNGLFRLGIPKRKLVGILAEGEKYVGTEGGGMDQAASLLGKENRFVKVSFDPIRARPYRFSRDHTVFVCHSLVSAEKSAGVNREYNRRVIECRMGKALIGAYLTRRTGKKTSLDPLARIREFTEYRNDHEALIRSAVPLPEYSLEDLCRELGQARTMLEKRYLTLKDGSIFQTGRDRLRIRSRLRHVFSEAKRVEQSVDCLKKKDMDTLGKLMNRSHASCRNDYEVSCPELDELAAAALECGALGARLTGAGFGGCTVNLVEKKNAEIFRQKLSEKYYRSRTGEPSRYIFECALSEGARRIAEREV